MKEIFVLVTKRQATRLLHDLEVEFDHYPSMEEIQSERDRIRKIQADLGVHAYGLGYSQVEKRYID